MGESKEAKTVIALKSYYRLRRGVGLSGMLLPYILMIGHWEVLPSISAYYYTPWGVAFVGILIVCGTFLMAYKGYDNERWFNDDLITNIAGLFLFLDAIFTTVYNNGRGGCPTPVCFNHWPVANWVHLVGAVLFFILTGFFIFAKFTKKKPVYDTPEEEANKDARNRIYKICAVGIWGSLILMFVGYLNRDEYPVLSNVVFWSELLILQFFGVAWLVKGKALNNMTKVFISK